MRGRHRGSGQLAHGRPTSRCRHWTSTTSLLELVAFLDAGKKSETPGKPRILLMDCAPVHISMEYRAAMQGQWPHVKLVNEPNKFTAVAQPLLTALLCGHSRHVWRDSQQTILRPSTSALATSSRCSRHGFARPSPKLLSGHIFCCLEESDSNSRHV